MGANNYGDSLTLIPAGTIFTDGTAAGPLGKGSGQYGLTGNWLGPAECGALRSAKEIVFLLDVTAAATAAGDTLNVKVQFGLPGATSIVPHDFVSFNQVLGNGGAKQFIARWVSNPGYSPDAINNSATLVPSVALSASVIQQGPITDLIRYTIAITDATTDDASFTLSLKAYVKG